MLKTFFLTCICMSVLSENIIPTDDILSITLTEQTRGTQKTVVITPTETTVEINGKITTKKTIQKEWKNITDLINQLNIKNLDKIKIPSNRHASDAAMITTLTIKTKTGEHSTPTFDNTNPPKNLVATLKAMKQSLPASVQKEFVY